MFRCLGILREVQHSPNRETDDALVLKAVLAQLENLGMKTGLLAPEEFDGLSPGEMGAWDMVLPMCEAYPRLMRLLAQGEADRGLWINSPQAVLNCYRSRMLPTLAREGVSLPPTDLRAVSQDSSAPPGFPAPEGWWIKRGDVHNTCDRDVVRLESWERIPGILRDFSSREITHYAVQKHIDGDLVKFYGVGPGRWFTWFFHDPVRARRIPFVLDDLAGEACRAARALGVEVFGGDAIIAPGGKIWIIDVNSWPSFALVRDAAAVQISWHLQNRLLARKVPSGDR